MNNLYKVVEKLNNPAGVSVDELRTFTEDGNPEFVESLIEMLRHDVKSAEDAEVLESVSVSLRDAIRLIRQQDDGFLLGQLHEKLFPITDPFSQVALFEPAFS